MQNRFFADPEAILGSLARLFASEGKAKEVAVLTYSQPEVVETGYDNWNGGISFYSLFLHVPLNLYPQIEGDRGAIEKAIVEKAQVFLEKFPGDKLTETKIVPTAVEDAQWREKATAWLSGEKVSNQGRVRSDNVAPLSADGLLFRSQPEIHLYRALKAVGVSFAPLPVFVRGGETYSRLEPDFVIVKSGIVMVVEVDGDTVHLETPVEAHARTVLLQHEGVYVERVLASDCSTPEKAKALTQRILASIQKRKEAQR
jgi:hypothetical protein